MPRWEPPAAPAAYPGLPEGCPMAPQLGRCSEPPEGFIFRGLGVVAGARFELWKRPLKFDFLLSY